jgi:hypothetical protein
VAVSARAPQAGSGSTYNSPTPASAVLAGEDAIRQRLKQGRASCGTDMKIVDAEGSELPWDGKAFGDFLVRGHWVVVNISTAAQRGRRILRAGCGPVMSAPSTLTAAPRLSIAPRTSSNRAASGSVRSRSKTSRSRIQRSPRRRSSPPATQNGRSGRCCSWCRAPERESTRTSCSP